MSTKTGNDEAWRINRPEDFGRALAGVRTAQGLSQVDLAELLGVQRSYVAAIEAGASVQMLERLLRAFRRLGAEITVALPPDEPG